MNNRRFSTLSTWCGIIRIEIVGPPFYKDILKGDIHNDIANNSPNLLMGLSNIVRKRIWLQQDCDPTNYAVAIHNTFDERFPDKRIGLCAAVGYPACFPDFTCLDYYLWERLKIMVYVERPNLREGIMERIINAVASISPKEIQRLVT